MTLCLANAIQSFNWVKGQTWIKTYMSLYKMQCSFNQSSFCVWTTNKKDETAIDMIGTSRAKAALWVDMSIENVFYLQKCSLFNMALFEKQF